MSLRLRRRQHNVSFLPLPHASVFLSSSFAALTFFSFFSFLNNKKYKVDDSLCVIPPAAASGDSKEVVRKKEKTHDRW